MARKATALTIKKLEAAKPKAKPYKLFDGGGLFLEVMPAGGRYWRMKYRYAGAEKRLALGVFDDVGLAEARAKREEIKTMLRAGIDPGAARKAGATEALARAANTFETVARDWVSKMHGSWTPKYAAKLLKSMEGDLFPKLGSQPLAEITPMEVLAVVKLIEGRDALEIAVRAAQRCSAVFRHGILTGRCTTNPAAELREVIKTRKVTHRAALSRDELPTFLPKLQALAGRAQTRIAIQLVMLTFVRTGELRGALWVEIDFDRTEWRIPAERMKMREPHIVPLSSQAIELLRELGALTGTSPYLFPSVTNWHKPMSENTVLYALYRMGYHSRATGHGFRALASTCLNEMGFRSEVIERQLAHAERNKVRAAYNRAQYLDDRRQMMQTWADFIDTQARGKVIAGNFGKAA